MTTKEYLIRRKAKDWRFSTVVAADSFTDVNLIHPLKQREVKEIVDAARMDENVRRIVIFGSSIRFDCNEASDLDICIDWSKDCYDAEGVLLPFTRNMRKVISAATKGKADVLNYAYLDGTAVKEAVQEGVLVYEHDV